MLEGLKKRPGWVGRDGVIRPEGRFVVLGRIF